MDIKKIISLPFWFILGAFFFLVGALRLFLADDRTGGFIYTLVALLFCLGYVGQRFFNKKKVKS